MFVGFDMTTDCCESFGWFICSTEPNGIIEDENPEELKTEGYIFDVNFFKELETSESAYFENGGMVIFRLTNGNSEMFLALHNTHNGYYSHGFRMHTGGQTIHCGSV